MRVLLVAALLLSIGVFAAEPVAAQPPQPPVVGSCNFLTNPCWDGSPLCVWVSLQVPVCLAKIT